MAKEYVALLTYPCYSRVSIGCRGAEVDKMMVIITTPGVQRKSHCTQGHFVSLHGKQDYPMFVVNGICTLSYAGYNVELRELCFRCTHIPTADHQLLHALTLQRGRKAWDRELNKTLENLWIPEAVSQWQRRSYNVVLLWQEHSRYRDARSISAKIIQTRLAPQWYEKLFRYQALVVGAHIMQ